MPGTSVRCWSVALIAVAAAISPSRGLRAQATHGGHAAPTVAAGVPERLGEISFPTSAKGPAAVAFQHGVLYLHNFHYPQAAAEFRRARALDPRNVLAAEFEALTYTHAVWNQQDTALARAALRSFAVTREARLAATRTPRERGWAEAIEALYSGDTPKATRDTAFCRAMARLHAEDQSDTEAASFYALSLLGLNQGVREPIAYAKAEAISDTVLRSHPRHPGALHYKIHSVDDPTSAARGLGAARQYSVVATSAAHALHMTGHIFMPLGMWDDVVSANLQAYRAQPPQLRGFGHSTHWLEYAYLQQGKLGLARAWLDSMLTYRDAIARGAIPAPRGRSDAEIHARLMAATFVVDAEAWDTPLARLRFDGEGTDSLVPVTTADFFVAYAALRRVGRPVDVVTGSRAADRVLADSLIKRIAARIAAARTSGETVEHLATAAVMHKQLLAERQVSVGDWNSAIALFRSAGDQIEAIPFEFGPPNVVKPPRERAGELLFWMGRNTEALAELDKSEKMWPARTFARTLRARTLLAMNRAADAAREYALVGATLHDADVAFPSREEVRWGSNVLPRIASDKTAHVDTVAYPSGELTLRGALYRPPLSGKHPGIVILHGSGECFPIEEQDVLGRLFARSGYVAFLPCRRGLGLSTGQGVTALEQLNREGLSPGDTNYARRSTELLERNELADVRAAIAALRARPDVDASRVAVTGMSYGGVLTLMSAESDSTIRAAVAFAPAAMNWGWNAPLREHLLAGARRTRVPVLVVQAENDWNVGPTRDLPAAVRDGGGVGDGRMYPAVGGNAIEGHQLMVHAPDIWRTDVLAFLDAHLKPARR